MGTEKGFGTWYNQQSNDYNETLVQIILYRWISDQITKSNYK